jgi:hypothetical protein
MIDSHTQPTIRYVYVNKDKVEWYHSSRKIDDATYAEIKRIVKEMSGKDWNTVPGVLEYLDCGSLGTFQN